MAAPGVPLLTVEDPSRFRLEATVDESQIGAVRLGETVPVVIDALGEQTIEGKVTQIVPTADPASRTFTVKIDLPANPQIRTGLFGRARFARGQHEAIAIPQDGVCCIAGNCEPCTWWAATSSASLRYVTLGQASADQVEVLSGLQNGDRIVAAARRSRIERQTS